MSQFHPAFKALLCFIVNMIVLFHAGLMPGQSTELKIVENEIDLVVNQAIKSKRFPGCTIEIGSSRGVHFLKAYGDLQLMPNKIPMNKNAVFDLASLTKPLATATSIMLLVDQGKLRLSDTVRKHWPEFAQNGKSQVTIEHLLLHTSGLIADNSLKDYQKGSDLAIQKIEQLPLRSAPGSQFVYSDVGYIVLGELVKRKSGLSLDEFAAKRIFGPLGMRSSQFRPAGLDETLFVPTEKIDGKWRKGKVHDPRALLLDGVAGHAGLFSNASDLGKYATSLLKVLHSVPSDFPMKQKMVLEMVNPRRTSGGLRSLGWDVRSVFSGNRGVQFSDKAFGHGGFTGTGLWIDPVQDIYVVFLSSRLHPNGKGYSNGTIAKVNTIAANRLGERKANSELRLGVDQLADHRSFFQGKRIGLITNQTGVDRTGKSTIDVVNEMYDLKLLFSPEHGIRGTFEGKVSDSTDAATGVSIISLYGKQRAPDLATLKKLDVLVFDIQDIGTRFYTYVSTMYLAMEAASRAGIPFVVLDRPNPLGGHRVQGPVLDEGQKSFVGMQRIPVVHGMTAGELAGMYHDLNNLDNELKIIPCKNWKRAQKFDDLGLRWINPSPNIRNSYQAEIYPAFGMLEFTNLSVGRGTATPFEKLGAPWIKKDDLAAKLNDSGQKGVFFVPVSFTPSTSKYRGQRCHGVQMIVTQRDQFKPVGTGIQIALALRELYPRKWKREQLVKLVGHRKTIEKIELAQSLDGIKSTWKEEIDSFLKRREKYLLYK